jgi:hypothetical protein
MQKPLIPRGIWHKFLSQMTSGVARLFVRLSDVPFLERLTRQRRAYMCHDIRSQAKYRKQNSFNFRLCNNLRVFLDACWCIIESIHFSFSSAHSTITTFAQFRILSLHFSSRSLAFVSSFAAEYFFVEIFTPRIVNYLIIHCLQPMQECVCTCVTLCTLLI